MRPTLFVPMTGKAGTLRETKPDAAKPKLVNGSFEQTYIENEKEVPSNWHYVRQAQIVADETEAPDGKQFIVFSNSTPGRGSQAVQGFAVDGKVCKAIEVMFEVRGKDIRPGATRDQMPLVAITFYDERQDVVGDRAIGPWRGTFKWQREHSDPVDEPRRRGFVPAVMKLDVRRTEEQQRLVCEPEPGVDLAGVVAAGRAVDKEHVVAGGLDGGDHLDVTR